MTLPDRNACLRAVASRDARFDGMFFTAVTSTGIYCRPSCPAMTPKPRHTRFYPSAAAAQDAGFRACKRCRPDASPGSPDWDVRADVAARAMRLIADGVVERAGVSGLAAQVGYSARQLERLLAGEVGAGPLALARSRRAQTARVLIENSDLPLTEVAYAAGFGSLRSFNETVRATYAATPTALRQGRRRPRGPGSSGPWHRLDLRLAFRTPFEPSNLFGHLVATMTPGVEEWRDGGYRRTLALPHGPAVVALAPRPDHVAATVWLTDHRDLTPAVQRCRRLLDLDSDPVAVAEALAEDPALAPLIAAVPGRRVPRTVDAAELAIRVVLGQQISTAAAATHAGRLAERCGEPVDDPGGGLTRLFPSPEALAGADPAHLALPKARVATVRALAGAVADGTLDLSAGADWAAAREGLAALPGIGPWSVALVAMRGLGDPDAFPDGDLGVVRALRALGLPAGHAARWRPWRSYAVQYLWATLDHPINHLPKEQP